MRQDLAAQKPLASIIRDFRTINGLTRRQLSERGGIPYSTLSKVEKGELSLSYDQIRQLCHRLDTRVEDFLDGRKHYTICRRSLGTIAAAPRMSSRHGVRYFLCDDILKKRMTPILQIGFPANLEACGDFVRNAGETFVFVARGVLIVHTEFYSAVELAAGESIYLGDGMAHALVGRAPAAEATALYLLSDRRDGRRDDRSAEG